MTFDTFITFHNFFCINWKFFVRVDNDAEEARVSLKNKKTMLYNNNHIKKTAELKKNTIFFIIILQSLPKSITHFYKLNNFLIEPLPYDQGSKDNKF